MNSYFFDIKADGRLFTDAGGSRHRNDADARDEAVRILQDLARDELGTAQGDREFVVVGRNVAGTVVVRAALQFSISEGSSLGRADGFPPSDLSLDSSGDIDRFNGASNRPGVFNAYRSSR